MKVGINCLNIDPSYRGGINSYIFGLLNAWKKEAIEATSFTLFTYEKNANYFSEFSKYDHFSIHTLPNQNPIKYRILWQFVKIQSKFLYKHFANFLFKNIQKEISYHCDIIYFPNTVIFPYNYTIPTVLSMHDIQQVHYPDFFTPIELKDRYITYNLSAEHVSYLQASSQHMKEDFLNYFNRLEPNQVLSIHEGVDIKTFNTTSSINVTEKYNLPKEFLFFPAQLWLHKNHISLLKALVRIRDVYGKEIPLILTGEKASASTQIFTFIKEKNLTQVKYLGKVPFEDLIALYQKASFLITTVLYESSSLPILEAAAAGTPILASNTKPNIEMAKTLSISLFNPIDIQAICTTMLNVWDNKELQEKQVTENSIAIYKYSWGSVAKKYHKAFKKINA